MLDILIVEGNTAVHCASERNAGRKSGSESYRDALALHGADMRFAMHYAYAPEWNDPATDFTSFDGFALAGSGVSWNAAAPEAKPYLALQERIFQTGKPVVGSCWAMQTAAVLLGGEVGINPRGSEMGVASIQLTQQGRNDAIFAGLPARFDQPASHRDHVTRLPDGAMLLAYNEISPVQSYVHRGNGVDFVGFQFHPELELGLIRQWHESRPPQPGTPRVNANFPASPSRHIADPLERTRVVGNWLDYLRRMQPQTAERLGDAADAIAFPLLTESSKDKEMLKTNS